MFALATMFKATICFCVAPCDESAPVLKLWATKAAAECIVESLVQSAQTYFFAVSQDDSNYCKHVIKQDLLFYRNLLYRHNQQQGQNDWLSIVLPRFLSSAAQEQQSQGLMTVSLEELYYCTL